MVVLILILVSMSPAHGLDRAEIADRYVALAGLFGSDADVLKVQCEAERFLYCGDIQRVYECPKCSHKYKAPSSCNSRICPTCSQRMAHRFQSQFLEAVRPFWSRQAKTYGPKFLTLTFTTARWSGAYPSRAEFRECKRLVNLFVLRFYSRYKAVYSRHGRWYAGRRVLGAGAVAVPEFGKGNNLHFHLLAYGPYYRRDSLIAFWKQITGDSWLVDIREPKGGPKAAVRYVLKYIQKPPKTDSPTDLAAWAWLLKGSRRLATYGILYGRVRSTLPPDEIPFECVWCHLKLSFIGYGLDPHDRLLAWSEWRKYWDTGPPVGLSHLVDVGYRKNLTYQLQTIEDVYGKGNSVSGVPS